MNAYRVATRYSLVELARNQLAALVLVFLIPIAISLAYFVITREVLTFRLRTTGTPIQAAGQQATTISCALNAVSLLVGFAMFASAHRAGAFDRRLAGAGYSRLALVLAKLTTLLVAAVIVGGYATAWIAWYWSIQQPVLLWTGMFLTGVVYGAIGLFFALFLPGELEGMFIIILITVIDNVLQNPITNPASDAGVVTLLPGYGAMQTCLAAGFTDTAPVSPILLSLGWAAAFGAIAFGTFVVRTRNRTRAWLPALASAVR
ncbi:hypothetical protein [Kibdelosporangium aridum]|uniref:Uncharacterized protein n=1 Tax=Kibdelosporangium aridum TaxID=2030 RepID=A0A1W2CYW1_KIBAR|nr:hypothetical protein [Kibdelosporangium aridum]SMC90360.1 hypothetical protein SAMN05661093_02654 [Kibdelosporangium aridum]